jgi:Putative adhesin
MDVRREELETPGVVTLDARLSAGRLEIETGPAGSVLVELEPLGGEESVRAVQDARIEVRREGDRSRVLVHVRGERRLLRFGKDEVRARIRVPERSDVEASAASADVESRGLLGSARVEVASGEVELDALAGDAEVSSASGDVELRSVEGDAVVNTASGDVRIASIAGAGRIRTASGDVAVADARGPLDVQSASGDQRVEAAREGRISLKSASGDLSIGIRQGSTLWVDARSMSGDMSSEIELDAEPGDDGGGPLVELRAISMSGDVEVRRAPAA